MLPTLLHYTRVCYFSLMSETKNVQYFIMRCNKNEKEKTENGFIADTYFIFVFVEALNIIASMSVRSHFALLSFFALGAALGVKRSLTWLLHKLKQFH